MLRVRKFPALFRFLGPGILVGVIPAFGQQPDMARVQHEYEAGYAAASSGDLAAARQHFSEAVKLAPQLAEAHNALGSVELEMGQAKQAGEEFRLALAIKPLRSARENLGLAYAAVGEKAKAREQFARAAAESSLSPAAALVYAPLLVGNHQLAEAATMLRRTVDETPTEAAGAPQAARAQLAALHDALGSVLAQQQQWPEAQQQFQAAIALDDTSAAHFHLGVLFLDQGQADAALPELARAAAISPDDPAVLLYQGEAFTAAHRDADALDTLRKAEKLAEGPGVPAEIRIDIAYQLALALQNTTQPGDAVPYFARVVAARPRQSDALGNYALALVQTGKAKDAIPFYKRAIAEDPKSVTLQMGLGAAYLQQNELADAEAAFRAGLALAPDDAEVHYDLGLALKLRDKLGDAEPELKRAAQLDPSLVDPHVTLGTMYMQQGKFDEAAAEMKLVLDAQPENGDMWATYGSTLKQAGKLEDAVAALRKAIALRPEQPGPHTTLAAILQQQGRTEEASAERKAAAGLTRGAMNQQAAMFATNAGDLLLSRGQIDDAIAQYRTAIKDDAAYRPAHRQLALALEQKGQKAEAESERRLGADHAGAP